MTKQFTTDVILKDFPVDIEYSIDNGISWNTLSANTQHTILVADLPSNGKVKVRTTNTITSLDNSNIGLDTTSLSEVNIKQGQDLTNLSYFAQNSTVKNLRVANTPNVTQMIQFGYRSAIKNLILDETALTAVTNIDNFLQESSVNYISELKFNSVNHAISAFCDLSEHISYLRELYINEIPYSDNSSYSYYQQLLDGFKAKVAPKFYLSLIGSYNQIRYILGTSSFPYILSSYFNVNDYNNKDFMQTSNMYFNNSTMKITACRLDSYNDEAYFMSSMSNLIYPFKHMYINKPYTTATNDFLANSSNLKYANKDKLLNFLNSTKTGVIIDELNRSIPYVIDIGNFDGTNPYNNNNFVKTYKPLGAYGLHLLFIDKTDYKIYRTEFVEDYDQITTLVEMTQYNILIDDIWFNRDGGYTIQDGADLKNYDENGNLISTIAGVIAKHIWYSQNNTKILVTSGDSIDDNNSADQNITNTITQYDVVSGNQELQNSVSMTNYEVIGAIQSNSDDTLKIVYAMHPIDPNDPNRRINASTNINSVKSLTYIDYILEDSVSIDEPRDTVLPHYIDSNEFVVIDTNSGNINRLFGS